MRHFAGKFVEKIETHILCSVTFFFFALLWDNLEKYCRAGQTTDDIMAQAYCMVDA
jgi:hypothetical protein